MQTVIAVRLGAVCCGEVCHPLVAMDAGRLVGIRPKLSALYANP